MKVNVIVANRGAGDVAVKQVKFERLRRRRAACDDGGVQRRRLWVPGGGRAAAARARRRRRRCRVSRKDQVAHCEPTLTIPATARVSEPYWHRDGRGRALHLRRRRAVRPADAADAVLRAGDARRCRGGEEVIEGLPVQHRYEGNIFSGEKRTELLVVPAFSVRVTPEIAIVPARRSGARPGCAAGAGRSRPRGAAARASRPARRAAAEREVRVTVVNDTPGRGRQRRDAGSAEGLDRVAGRSSRSSSSRSGRIADGAFRGEAGGRHGAGRVSRSRRSSSTDGRTFDRGYQMIEYPHIRRHHIYDAAAHDAESDRRANAGRT